MSESDVTRPGWADAAGRELDQIVGRHAAKKRATILAVVGARLRNEPVERIFDRPETCARSVYYGKWLRDPQFSATLARVTTLAQHWQTEQELTELTRRQADWVNKMVAVTDVAADRLAEMAAVAVSDGWTYGDFSRMLLAVDKTGRLARSLTTERTEAIVAAPDLEAITGRVMTIFAAMQRSVTDE